MGDEMKTIFDPDLSPADVQNMQDRQAQTLQTIQELQNIEKQLYENLSVMSSNGANQDKQDLLIRRINDLSTTRINLYNNVKDMYDNLQTNVADTRTELVDQMTVVGIVEQELNNAKRELNALKDSRYGKLRMVEINTYYGKKYEAHSGLMKLIIITCIPLLVLAILTKKGFVPDNISKLVGAFILVIGAIFIFRRLIDITMRSNMDFDEYSWLYADTPPPTVYQYDKEHLGKLWKDISVAGCVGPLCCTEGMVYDNEMGKCVIGSGDGQGNGDKSSGGWGDLGKDIASKFGAETFVSGANVVKGVGEPGGFQPFSQCAPTFGSV